MPAPRSARPVCWLLLGLLACSNTATLDVDSTPPGAAVIIDGTNTGAVTPCVLTPVYAGFHVVELKLGNFHWDDTIRPSRFDTCVVRAAFGEPKWSRGFPARLGPAAVGTSGAVYVAAGETLYAADSAGTLSWARALDTSACAGPSVGQHVYVATYRSLFAFDADGAPAWSQLLGDVPARALGIALAADGTIYVASVAGLQAFGPDGSSRWLRPFVASSAPVVGADGTVYAADGGWLAAFRPADGTTLWRHAVDSLVSGVVSPGADGVVCVSLHNKLVAVRPDGTRCWEFAGGQEHGGYFSGAATGGNGEVTVMLGDLLWRLRRDGVLDWSAAGFRCGGIPEPAPTLLSDGTVLDGGSWHLGFRALDATGRSLWDFRDGAIGLDWTPAAALADGTIYVTHNHVLYALKAGAGAAVSPWPMYQHDPQRTGRAGT